MSAKLFTYTALDQNGIRQTGVLQAHSQGAAIEELGKRGYRVEQIQEGKPFDGSRDPVSKNILGPAFGGVNFETLQRFYSQLWSMYKSGVPLVQALDSLADTSRHPNMRPVIRKMREYVVQGRPLSDCMREYPEVFSPLQHNLIRIGEQGGSLDSSLYHLKEYLAREIKLRNKLKAATFYGKILIAAVILIPLVANAVVTSVLGRANTPGLGIISFGSNALVLFAIAFFILYWLFLGRLLMSQPPIRYVFHRALLLTPYIGGTVTMLAMAKFSRAFSVMHRGGVPIAQCVTLAAEACGNDYIAAQIRPAAFRIQEGRSIAASLAETGAFTRITVDMANTGEQSGNMEAMFENVAEQYEDEADVRAEKMVRVIPVIIILIAGVIVAYIVVSFFTGYYQSLLESGSD